MDADITAADVIQIVAQSPIPSNMFSISRLLSSFDLAKDYQTLLLGMWHKTVSTELLNAHKEQVARHALQILMRSLAGNNLRRNLFMIDDSIWTWYRSTKSTERDEWIPMTVVKANQHFLEAQKSPKGRIMGIADKDIRFKPQG